jgi:hypothetical protein
MLDQLFKDVLSANTMNEQEAITPETAQSNVTMQEDLVDNQSVVTTQETTKLPQFQSFYGELPMESFKPTQTGKSPGLTKEAPGKHDKLYETNLQFLTALEENIAKGDRDFIFNAFSSLNKKPVIGNKVIELSEISTYMKTPAYRKQLIEQALELESDPSMPSDTRFSLMRNHSMNIIKSGELMHARKLHGQDMLAVAKWAQFQEGVSGKNYFKMLLDKDGNFLSEKEFYTVFANYNKKKLEVWDKEHPFPKDGPIFWQRTDMPNPMANARPIWNDKTKKWEQPDSRPKMINSQEGWQIARESVTDKIPNYKELKKNFLEAYALDNSPAKKIRTNFESRFGPSKGGEVQGVLATIDFDILKGAVAFKGKAALRPEIVELANIFKLANDAGTADNGVKIAFGKKTGSLPEDETISENAKTVVKAVLEDLGSAATRRKDANSRLPKGQISFSSIVAGGEPYYAYNIKFNNDYINTTRFKGTKDAQGPAGADNNPELLTDGITIYVPAKLATGVMPGADPNKETPGHSGGVVSRLARDSKKATAISPIEGLFTVQNDLQFRIPNGGQLNLIRTPEGETHVSGWNVGINPNTGKTDTFHIPKQLVPFDRATDLDWIVDDFLQNAYQNVLTNDSTLTQLNKDKKVFDPNILKHTY